MQLIHYAHPTPPFPMLLVPGPHPLSGALVCAQVDAAEHGIGSGVDAIAGSGDEALQAKTLALYQAHIRKEQRLFLEAHDEKVTLLIDDAPNKEIKEELEKYKSDQFDDMSFKDHLMGAGIAGAVTFNNQQVISRVGSR